MLAPFPPHRRDAICVRHDRSPPPSAVETIDLTFPRQIPRIFRRNHPLLSSNSTSLHYQGTLMVSFSLCYKLPPSLRLPREGGEPK